MRTTLTLDDDVAAKLRSLMRRTGKSLKETVNETLRIGLTMLKPSRSHEPFEVRARRLELQPGMSYDNVEELLEQIDGPARR